MVERIVRPVRRLLGSDTAATAIEYSLIAALIAMVVAGTLPTIGTKLTAIFTKVAGYF